MRRETISLRSCLIALEYFPCRNCSENEIFRLKDRNIPINHSKLMQGIPRVQGLAGSIQDEYDFPGQPLLDRSSAPRLTLLQHPVHRPPHLLLLLQRNRNDDLLRCMPVPHSPDARRHLEDRLSEQGQRLGAGQGVQEEQHALDTALGRVPLPVVLERRGDVLDERVCRGRDVQKDFVVWEVEVCWSVFRCCRLRQ